MFDKKNHFSQELILFLEPSQLYILKKALITSASTTAFIFPNVTM
jgi:hypothetical protein